MGLPKLEYMAAIELRHGGDCSLLGVTPELTIYAEEVYGDGWYAQQAVRLDGTILAVADEENGTRSNVAPLPLPADAVRSQAGWHTMALNYAGPRHRGLRALERTLDLVRPLSIHDKIALVDRYRLAILPPSLLGLAESYVLAEAPLDPPHGFVVCRRVRLAFGLEQERVDEDNLPYDYDTLVLYLAHVYDRTQEQDVALLDPADTLPGARLYRPMDCIVCRDHLFVADGGDATRRNRVHVWRVERSEPPGDPDLFETRLYGGPVP